MLSLKQETRRQDQRSSAERGPEGDDSQSWESRSDLDLGL